MKSVLKPSALPAGGVLVMCSSHEERCKAVIPWLREWLPSEAVIFDYDDVNPRRDANREAIVEAFAGAGVPVRVLRFEEGSAVTSLRGNMSVLSEVVGGQALPIILDISVLTKRHLLMMLRWLDDVGIWDRLTVIYSEPADYEVSGFVPLSFGLASILPTPGFAATANLSRPIHLILFLGYEGDRALATYEAIQPMRTTLVLPDPPYRDTWAGRTERFNADLLELVGMDVVERVDPIDPSATKNALDKIVGSGNGRSSEAAVVCPLGTKPQAMGVYSFVRSMAAPPAVVYAGPLRHNHGFFSTGIGNSWTLKRGRDL